MTRARAPPWLRQPSCARPTRQETRAWNRSSSPTASGFWPTVRRGRASRREPTRAASPILRAAPSRPMRSMPDVCRARGRRSWPVRASSMLGPSPRSAAPWPPGILRGSIPGERAPDSGPPRTKPSRCAPRRSVQDPSASRCWPTSTRRRRTPRSARSIAGSRAGPGRHEAVPSSRRRGSSDPEPTRSSFPRKPNRRRSSPFRCHPATTRRRRRRTG